MYEYTMESQVQTILHKIFDAEEVKQVKQAVKDKGSVELYTLRTMLHVTGIQFGSDEYHEMFDIMEELFECPVFVTCYDDIVAMDAEIYEEYHT